MDNCKRYIALLLILVFCIGIFAGCGESKEEPKVESRAEKARNKAVAISEKYLDFDISAKEAIEQLEDLADSLNKSDSAEQKVRQWIGLLIYWIENKYTDKFEHCLEGLKKEDLS